MCIRDRAVFPPKAHLPALTPVLELRNVTLRYKKQTILHDIVPVSYTHLDVYKRQAKAAHADSFIRRLPDGYDTVIAEDGGNISQGQKQLLCKMCIRDRCDTINRTRREGVLRAD